MWPEYFCGRRRGWAKGECPAAVCQALHEKTVRVSECGSVLYLPTWAQILSKLMRLPPAHLNPSVQVAPSPFGVCIRCFSVLLVTLYLNPAGPSSLSPSLFSLRLEELFQP